MAEAQLQTTDVVDIHEEGELPNSDMEDGELAPSAPTVRKGTGETIDTIDFY